MYPTKLKFSQLHSLYYYFYIPFKKYTWCLEWETKGNLKVENKSAKQEGYVEKVFSVNANKCTKANKGHYKQQGQAQGAWAPCVAVCPEDSAHL